MNKFGIGEKNNQARLKKMILIAGSFILRLTALVAADADEIKNLPAINQNGDTIKYIFKLVHETGEFDKYD